MILHIETPKTGTTALQDFLFRNREILSSYGIDYPVFTDQPSVPGRARNGIFLDRYARSVARKDNLFGGVSDIEDNLARLKRALSGDKKVLLTDEGFARPLPRDAGRTYEHELHWHSIARILEDAGAGDVTVVVYLRRQDDWITSKWRQNIKRNHEERLLGDFCNTSRNRGIDAARGDYLSFVEPDDCVSPGFYELLYTTAVSDGCHDIAKGVRERIEMDGRRSCTKSELLPER